MYLWYFLVSAVSLFDNLVATPFVRNWAIRVSRRPGGILLDDSVRKITRRNATPTCSMYSGGGEFVHAIAELGLQIEMQDHFIINRYCVKSRSKLFSPETYIGLLAKPHDVKLAEQSTRGAVASTFSFSGHAESHGKPDSYLLSPMPSSGQREREHSVLGGSMERRSRAASSL